MAKRSTPNNESPQPGKNDQNLLDLIAKESMELDLHKVAPEINSTRLPEDSVVKILERLGESMGLPSPHTFLAVVLLFLKGAASAGAPNSMEVSVMDPDGVPVTVQKYDLLNAYSRVTGNKFLRRLAEAMAEKIGIFAELKGLNGDLAIKINNALLANGEAPLNAKERSWASSFSQGLTNLEDLAGPRLQGLLAADLQGRIAKNKRTKKRKIKRQIKRPKKLNQKRVRKNKNLINIRIA